MRDAIGVSSNPTIEKSSGHAEAGAARRLIDADRHLVVAGEHRGRPRGRRPFEQLLRAVHTRLERVAAFEHELRIELQAELREPFFEAAQPLVRRAERRRPADVCDALVTQRCDVARGRRCALASCVLIMLCGSSS